MASKLNLQSNPTFKCKVAIPVPGGEPVPVEIEYRHHSVSSINKFWEEHSGAANVEVVWLLVAGWDLEDEYNRDNLQALLDNYPGAAAEIVGSFTAELYNARRGN